MSRANQEDVRVGELAASVPGAREVFDRFGIDYCCGGDSDLRTAAMRKGVKLETLLAELRQAAEAPPRRAEGQKDWSAATLGELADYIEAKHHKFMKEQLARL